MRSVRAGGDVPATKGLRSFAQDRSYPVRAAVEPAVSVVFEIDIGELHAPTRRSARAAFARQVAMYLSHVACGLSLAEVSSVFARDRSTVAHACELVEDRRDDPVLDAKLEYLERAVSALLGALSLQRGRQ